MKKYRLSIIGFSIAFLIYLSSVIFDLDLFERLVQVLRKLEHYEVDEFIIPGVILLIIFAINQFRIYQKAHTDLEKYKIFKAVISSTYEVINDFLNQMQYFKHTAEKTPEFDPELLKLYDEVLAKTLTQLKSLRNIKDVTEENIKSSIEVVS